MDFYEKDREEINTTALTLFHSREFKRMVNKTIQKVLSFNRSCTYEDYYQESFVACVEAIQKYNKLHKRRNGKGGTSGMKLRTYAMWHVFKAIHRLADSGEVVWNVIDPQGNYIETIFNKEYRRIKKTLEKQGYTFQAVSVIEDTYEDENGNTNENRYFVVMPDFLKDIE